MNEKLGDVFYIQCISRYFNEIHFNESWHQARLEELPSVANMQKYVLSRKAEPETQYHRHRNEMYTEQEFHESRGKRLATTLSL